MITNLVDELSNEYMCMHMVYGIPYACHVIIGGTIPWLVVWGGHVHDGM
jgi:hypothetical protein